LCVLLVWCGVALVSIIHEFNPTSVALSNIENWSHASFRDQIVSIAIIILKLWHKNFTLHHLMCITCHIFIYLIIVCTCISYDYSCLVYILSKIIKFQDTVKKHVLYVCAFINQPNHSIINYVWLVWTLNHTHMNCDHDLYWVLISLVLSTHWCIWW